MPIYAGLWPYSTVFLPLSLDFALYLKHLTPGMAVAKAAILGLLPLLLSTELQTNTANVMTVTS